MPSDRFTDFSLNRLAFQIRNQMNVVLGTVDLFRTTGTDSEQDGYLNMLEQAAESLLHASNEIAELSQIASDELKLNPTVFRPEDQLKHLIASPSITRIRQGKDIDLHIEIDSECPESLKADHYVFMGVLDRLVRNAFQFSESGTIVCSVEFKENELICSVSDEGAGLTEKQQSELFLKPPEFHEDFFDFHTGVGLGLYISAMLLKKVNGTISIESRENEGSRFTFRIPAESAKDESLSTVQTAEEVKLNILYAEDNADNRLIMERLFSRTNWTLDMAVDGAQAVEKFRSGQYDVLLFDVEMPVMNGIEATKQIRKIEQEKGLEPVPIIALTAQAMQSEKDDCISAGMNAHLAKPVRSGELNSAVLSILKKN